MMCDIHRYTQVYLISAGNRADEAYSMISPSHPPPLQAKVLDAEQTEQEIDTTRSKYIPVAVRTQLLFFCTTDLSNIDPMYQYSLEWFVGIFLNAIASAEKSGE